MKSSKNVSDQNFEHLTCQKETSVLSISGIKTLVLSQKKLEVPPLEDINEEEINAKEKLNNKNLDYVALNYANEEGAGFNSNTNHIYLYSKSGEKKELKLERKDRIAKKIIKYILGIS